jgi:hypothetical protein
MKRLIIIFFILLISQGYAYDVLYDASSPSNLGMFASDFNPTCGASTSTRWKSVRVRATASGNATHFLVKVGSNNIGSVPIGFAVYAGTGGYNDPIGALLKRGYVASYSFGNAGWYAFPFLNNETVSVISGNYYHLVYLLTPDNEGLASGCRQSSGTVPPKWASNCSNDCNPEAPPGVGGESWSFQYEAGSAPWVAGLLITAAGDSMPPAPPVNLR